MFLLTFIRYRPDVHARWVKTEHSAKVTAFLFACVLETACV